MSDIFSAICTANRHWPKFKKQEYEPTKEDKRKALRNIVYKNSKLYMKGKEMNQWRAERITKIICESEEYRDLVGKDYHDKMKAIESDVNYNGVVGLIFTANYVEMKLGRDKK